MLDHIDSIKQNRNQPEIRNWGAVLGSGGVAPSRRRHGDLGAEPPALENFAFFAKIT